MLAYTDSISSLKTISRYLMEIVHYHFKVLPSTNAWAKQNMHLFEKHKLTLISADMQTNGRGQYGRQWISPPDLNLYVSFCFFIEHKQQDPLSLTHVLAIAIIRLLEEKGIQAKIKWPNDILVDGKKIAGILCETVYFQEEFGVIIGIGFNVNMPKEIADSIDQPATSLFLETHQVSDLKEVLEALIKHFQNHLNIFLTEGFQPFQGFFKSVLIPIKT